MPCPFPGMDPYIERTAIWHDFQWSLVVRICGALQRLIKPKYVAMTNRLLCHEEDLFQLEVRILEPQADLRLATVIQVLNPQNKFPGPDRVGYLTHRERYSAAGVDVVEIDLLRAGQRVFNGKHGVLDAAEPWCYLVAVTRGITRHDVYVWPLQRRLPIISVPLAGDEKEVPLDLQAAFTRCWEEGAYPELLHYDRPPPGEMSEVEQRWCREQLAKAGFKADW